MKMFAGQAIRGLLPLGLIVFAGQAATLVQRPYLQNEREGRVTILWSARENIWQASFSIRRIKASRSRPPHRFENFFPARPD